MKYLSLIAAILISVTVHSAIAADTKPKRVVVAKLNCTGTDFRAGLQDSNREDHAKVWATIIKRGDQIHLEEFGGHVYVAGYYGLFNGKDLLEVPYKRATTYKNHYRFKGFDATFTAGHESGMWGEFIVNKDIERIHSRELHETDAHYVFQAGDHLGGTVDFVCRAGY